MANELFKDDCLIQQSTLAKVERPSAYDLKMLRRWLSNSAYGDSFLLELESDTWDSKHDKDFIATPRPDRDLQKDAFSRFALGPFLELYHTRFGRLYKVSELSNRCLERLVRQIWATDRKS